MRAAAICLATLSLGFGCFTALAQPPGRGEAAVPPADSRSSPSAAGTDVPVVLRQAGFNVPFTLNPAAIVPAEVHLHVSTDRGATWRLYDRAAPAAGHFAFRAAGDGEYWFALQTIESSGRAAGRTQPLAPGLRVVVDTAEPQVEFDATVGPAGEVNTSWRVFDVNLASETFKIEYQPRLDGPWQSIAVERQQSGTQTLDGRVTWWPETNSRVIHVRAEVSDRAANKAVVNQRVFLPKTASRPLSPAGSATANGRQDESGGSRAASGSGIPWPADSQAQRPAEASVNEAGKRVPLDPQQLAGFERYPPVAGDVQPPVGQEVKPAPEGESQQPPQASAASSVPPYGLPPGERPRMTHLTRFCLEYDVESVGPAGVAEVQLWGTADSGRTWKLWQTDADRQSPLEVEVPQEGIYGFRVVVVGNNGLAGRAPAAGDLADLWVGVDATKPVVRLTSAIYGEGRYAGNLDIRWEASDTWFAERPVALLFSENPSGPWSTIASGLPNTGQYYWAVEPRIPEKVFLRIEVQDEAGNWGEDQLTEPISTTGLVPSARIRGLRPAAPTPEAASRWRWFR